jgi:hypothetical protein
MTTDDRDKAIDKLRREVAVLEAEVRALRVKMDLAFARLERAAPDTIRMAVATAKTDLIPLIGFAFLMAVLVALVLIVVATVV